MATLTLNTTAVPASLASLNMSNVKKPTQQTAVQMRRNKLSKQLWEQVQLATALATGGSFAPIRVRTVKDRLTGERKTVEQPKRIKPWWLLLRMAACACRCAMGCRCWRLAKARTPSHWLERISWLTRLIWLSKQRSKASWTSRSLLWQPK